MSSYYLFLNLHSLKLPLRIAVQTEVTDLEIFSPVGK
jgi:hypothetical protein